MLYNFRRIYKYNFCYGSFFTIKNGNKYIFFVALLSLFVMRYNILVCHSYGQDIFCGDVLIISAMWTRNLGNEMHWKVRLLQKRCFGKQRNELWCIRSTDPARNAFCKLSFYKKADRHIKNDTTVLTRHVSKNKINLRHRLSSVSLNSPGNFLINLNCFPSKLFIPISMTR